MFKSWLADVIRRTEVDKPSRAETRALIEGEGGLNIHVFVFCPTNFDVPNIWVHFGNT